jgi:DNA-binding FadR family transcriptional regulator
MERARRRPSLNETIRDYVKEYIFDQGLAAGDPLPPETQLAQELGVGRGSVREAIKALHALGIVEVRHGDGLYVRPFNFDPILETLSYGIRFETVTLAELLQIRILLERSAIEEAIERISFEQIRQLESLMERWKQRVGTDHPHGDLDEEFHRILYTSLNNQTFMKLFEVFWIAYENLEDPIIRDMVRVERDYTTHRALLDAVKTKDFDAARKCMAQHFAHLEERIRLALDQVVTSTQRSDT